MQNIHEATFCLPTPIAHFQAQGPPWVIFADFIKEASRAQVLGLLSYVSSYNYILLISISFFEVLIVFFKILFYFVIAGVVKSWVAPFSENDMWKIVEEVSNKILDPIRKFIPAIGGLDFSPIFAFILLNSINVFLAQLAVSIL